MSVMAALDDGETYWSCERATRGQRQSSRACWRNRKRCAVAESPSRLTSTSDRHSRLRQFLLQESLGKKACVFISMSIQNTHQQTSEESLPRMIGSQAYLQLDSLRCLHRPAVSTSRLARP